jgi:hypothetical protein
MDCDPVREPFFQKWIGKIFDKQNPEEDKTSSEKLPERKEKTRIGKFFERLFKSGKK